MGVGWRGPSSLGIAHEAAHFGNISFVCRLSCGCSCTKDVGLVVALLLPFRHFGRTCGGLFLTSRRRKANLSESFCGRVLPMIYCPCPNLFSIGHDTYPAEIHGGMFTTFTFCQQSWFQTRASSHYQPCVFRTTFTDRSAI